MHVIYQPSLAPDNNRVLISGDEAHHAVRVKRVREGEHVIVLDGKGLVIRCRVVSAKRELELEILSQRREPVACPRVHVYSATPKGPRVDWLVDALVQVGAARWTPLHTKLGIVDPRQTKLDRLGRIAIEATKQARRPWQMSIGPQASLDEALKADEAVRLVIADAGAPTYQSSGAEELRLLVGPEGGWRPEELEQAQAAGATPASFGAHTMRIEMVCPVATSIILEVERRNRSSSQAEQQT